MASYRTSLTVDNTELPLRRIFFTASRSRDSKGKPSSGVNWLLFASIDVQEQFTFSEWMFDESMQKDVVVTFYKTDDEGEGETKLKEWSYNGTFCVGMLEMFAGDASYQTTNLFFTGKEVSNGNATMEHEWDLE
ncbi:type VI secretion system tube protein TssD [Spirosoma gilvum]